MSQLYLTGSVNIASSQSATSAFMDAKSNVMISGYASADGPTSALAVMYNARGIAWQNTFPSTYSTTFADMVQLTDGTYMAVGSIFTSTSSGDEDMWLVNIDAAGNNTGSIQVGLPGVQTGGSAIVATPDGGFIASAIQIQNNATTTLLTRYAANKTIVWQKTQADFACYSINANADGTFILSGRNTPVSLESNPVAIIMDGSGNITMNTVFTGSSIYVLQASDAVQTTDGNFVLVAQGVIIKFSPTGSIIWSSTPNNAYFTSVAQLKNGNLALGGFTLIGNADRGYVAVTDDNGNNIIWDNSELMQGSVNTSVFIDPGYDVVWSAGTVPTGLSSSIIAFAAYNPVTTLSVSNGTKAYAFADAAHEAAATA